MKRWLYICCFFLNLSFQLPEKSLIRIFLAGDSTMSIKEFRAFPETGWGMPFKFFWDSTVSIENRARNGRSTKTFILEGHWQKIMKDARQGDYVLIQFGHNDESIDKKERYTSPDTFRTNLVRFILEAKENKVTPIMISPVSRRKFNSQGIAVETHGIYSELVKDVANQHKVFFIDLDKKSRELFQQLGVENSKLLFLHLAAGEHPNYPEGKSDNTHFNELGARLMAQIVLSELKQNIKELSERVVVPEKN